MTLSKKIFLLLCAGYTLLEVWEFTLLDPWQENFSGLFFGHGQYLLSTGYILATGLLLYGLTSTLWQPLLPEMQKGLQGACFLIGLCSVIPYAPQGNPFFNDLHTWLCIAGFAGYVYLWFKPVLLGLPPHPGFGIVLLAGAGFLAGFAWSGHISAIAEGAGSLLLMWGLAFCLPSSSPKRKNT